MYWGVFFMFDLTIYPLCVDIKVRCENSTGVVNEITVGFKKGVGELSPLLSHISHIDHLLLSDNTFINIVKKKDIKQVLNISPYYYSILSARRLFYEVTGKVDWEGVQKTNLFTIGTRLKELEQEQSIKQAAPSIESTLQSQYSELVEFEDTNEGEGDWETTETTETPKPPQKLPEIIIFKENYQTYLTYLIARNWINEFGLIPPSVIIALATSKTHCKTLLTDIPILHYGFTKSPNQ